MTRKLTLVIGIVSVIVLGIVIFLPGSRDTGITPPPEASPAEQLELFLSDKMDYGLRLSRILAERRIGKAQRIAAGDPALERRAREVIDSLRARLERQAKM